MEAILPSLLLILQALSITSHQTVFCDWTISHLQHISLLPLLFPRGCQLPLMNQLWLQGLCKLKPISEPYVVQRGSES